MIAAAGDASAGEQGYPLSPLQRMLRLMDTVRQGSGVMNVPIICRLEGTLDAAALVAAVGDLEARHDALRTRLRRQGLKWVQCHLPPSEGQVDIVDLRAEPNPEVAYQAALRAELARDLDLTTDRPYRVVVYRIADQRQTLVVNVHHLVTDAWSNAILIRDLAALYSCRRGARPPLPEPAGWQFGDFLARSSAQATDRAGAHQEFWQRKLAGVRPVSPRPAPPRPARLSPPAGQVWFELESERMRSLAATAQLHRASLFMALLAIFFTVLAEAVDEVDLAVGTVLANRSHEELLETVGFFANMVVLRVDLTGCLSFEQVLGLTRRTVAEALDHQGYVPMTASAGQGVQRQRGLETVVFHMLAGQDDLRAGLTFSGLDLRLERMPAGTGSRFDLELLVVPRAGGWEGVFRYAADQYSQDDIEGLAAAYLRTLAAVTG